MLTPGQLLRYLRFRVLRKANVRLPNLSVGIGITTRIETDQAGEVIFKGRAILSTYTKIVAHSNPERAGRVIFEDNVHLGDYSLILANGCDVTIGEQTIIAQFVKIIAINHSFMDRNILIRNQGIDRIKAGIAIGADCWLGAGSCILPGVTLGDGVVVGAMSVVTHDVAPYQVVAGNPARVIKERR